ncbi:MAG TPA: hypothetical protein VGE20_00580 [Ramlibacter sp.]
MKPLSTRFIAAAGLALGTFGAATAAHAGRGELHVTVGVQPASSYYVQPAPVYVQPRPVYVQPAPYGYSRHGGWDDRRWQRRGPYGDRDRDGIANVYDPDSPRNRRHARVYGPYGDLDRDGIRNIDDRDRDGDGIRNRRDRAPENPYRY